MGKGCTFLLDHKMDGTMNLISFIVFFLIGCALDLLRAVVIQWQWGWFITPWAHIVAPGVVMIWGLLILKSSIMGVGKLEPEDSFVDIVAINLSGTVTFATLGWLIHLFV
jgi:hypothetical protein